MQSMKMRGSADVLSALSRARKLRALGRINGPDLAFIEEHLNQVLARVAAMEELNYLGDPIEEG